jgi:hypothetical protein
MFDIDRITTANEAANGVAGYRKLLLSFAEGNVLETGVGASNNIRFYPHNKINSVTAIDYSPNALELALSKDQKGIDISYSLEDVEK